MVELLAHVERFDGSNNLARLLPPFPAIAPRIWWVLEREGTPCAFPRSLVRPAVSRPFNSHRPLTSYPRPKTWPQPCTVGCMLQAAAPRALVCHSGRSSAVRCRLLPCPFAASRPPGPSGPSCPPHPSMATMTFSTSLQRCHRTRTPSPCQTPSGGLHTCPPTSLPPRFGSMRRQRITARRPRSSWEHGHTSESAQLDRLRLRFWPRLESWSGRVSPPHSSTRLLTRPSCVAARIPPHLGTRTSRRAVRPASTMLLLVS